jgi:hypothetical protein
MNLRAIRAAVAANEHEREDVVDLLDYIDSGQQVSEFTAFLLSSMSGDKEALDQWIRTNAEEFIRHLKER